MKIVTAWIAGIGSFLFPGLGFIYSRRFLMAYLSTPVLILPNFIMGWTDWIYLPSGFAFYIMATLALFMTIFIACIAIVIRHVKNDARGVAWFHYPVFIAFTLAFINPFTISTIREEMSGYNYYRVSSSAMSPTLNRGDIVIVDTWAYQFSEIENNDVILFSPPNPFNNLNTKWLMRVVAKQDDLVEIIDDHVDVNGKTMKGSIIVGDSIPSGKQVLSKDQFYVLGDNRRNSNDSRYWGILPHTHIQGKAKSVVYTETNGLTYKTIELF